jgi:hypothetical protein
MKQSLKLLDLECKDLIMSTKATLRIDKDLLEQAELISKKKKSSLSTIVSDYLAALIKMDQKSEPKTPVLREISGILKADGSPDSLISDYHAYLKKKYK